MGNKKYKFEKTVNGRFAIWYMETPTDKSKLGVWKIIDLYPRTRPTKFAFRWKVKGHDEQILGNAIRYFNKRKIYRGTKYENAETAKEA